MQITKEPVLEILIICACLLSVVGVVSCTEKDTPEAITITATNNTTKPTSTNAHLVYTGSTRTSTDDLIEKLATNALVKGAIFGYEYGWRRGLNAINGEATEQWSEMNCVKDLLDIYEKLGNK